MQFFYYKMYFRHFQQINVFTNSSDVISRLTFLVIFIRCVVLILWHQSYVVLSNPMKIFRVPVHKDRLILSCCRQNGLTPHSHPPHRNADFAYKQLQNMDPCIAANMQGWTRKHALKIKRVGGMLPPMLPHGVKKVGYCTGWVYLSSQTWQLQHTVCHVCSKVYT